MKLFMENKITKEKLLIITTILVVSLVLIGIGYAFFTASNPEGSTAQIISKSGRMLINYNDGTDNIIPVTNIQPGNNILVDKTFTLAGINTAASNGLSMPYVISIEYQNTFKNAELVYFIKRMDTNENISCTLKGTALLNEDLAQEFALPTSQVGYVIGYIDDWSGNTSTQELAYGEFKSSTEEQVLTLNLRMIFRDTGFNQDYNKGATFNGKIVVTAPEASTFATDTWEEIANNVKSGNASKYRVGSEKEVEIGGKSYTVRVANNTTPEECTREDFSQTACGFVVEFVDILMTGSMNSTSTNVGGWSSTEARELANGVYFSYLPSDLQKVIIDTNVISGHGSSDTNASRADGNWESTDKLYLLSAHEVYEDGTSISISTFDTAWNNTRQLDYYKARNVTTDGHCSSAMKWYNIDDTAYPWWLRAADSGSSSFFIGVSDNGDLYGSSAHNTIGFAPAFRIGENVNNV